MKIFGTKLFALVLFHVIQDSFDYIIEQGENIFHKAK